MAPPVERGEVFGLLHPAIDAHTIGISHVAQLIGEAGWQAVIGGREECTAVGELRDPGNAAALLGWIRTHRISRLGLSARLDPDHAVETLRRLRFVLRKARAYGVPGAAVRGLSFAGLPTACRAVRACFGDEIPTFSGDETAAETLVALGVPPDRIPAAITAASQYDDERSAFGRALVDREEYTTVEPPDRSGYPLLGSTADGLVARIRHSRRVLRTPLVRSHFGPFGHDRGLAVTDFVEQVGVLARSGHLDVLSIGTSQLTQERFGQDWQDRPNGGGVPINSPAEYERVKAAARPMLVRTYAGTARLVEMAAIHEQTLGNAWHALSLWWFSRLDGRGPNSVLENLREHLAALDYIAACGTPFEANVPHHFAFRGADDVTYVLAGVLAARVARARGIRHFVLQVMLNTPRHTAGVADLAKARALLALTRELAGPGFSVLLQPRAGLDYFSTDERTARAQLAAITALMCDIEPDDPTSPGIIHVVGFCEANGLATPGVIDESIQITRHCVATYQALRRRDAVRDIDRTSDVGTRTEHLIAEVRHLLRVIDREVANPESAEGLHEILRAGLLAVPYLWEEREEFAAATAWRTALVKGGVAVVDTTGAPVSARRRGMSAAAHIRARPPLLQRSDAAVPAGRGAVR